MPSLKNKRTPEEEAAHKATIAFNRKYAGFKRRLITLCGEEGLRSVELKLEYYKNTPSTPLPEKFMNYEQTIKAFEEAVAEYKEWLEIRSTPKKFAEHLAKQAKIQ
jgi:hypothetical protein